MNLIFYLISLNYLFFIFGRETPSPQPFIHREGTSGGGNSVSSMRPAVSLAQLCDVDPEEAPSSHRLIAQWENIIQKQQEVV